MPRRYNLSFAGQNFGFELPQVTDENKNTQTESVLADYFPELKLTYAPKSSRGGRLGRSTDQTTSEISLKQREAANAGSIGGNIPTNITINVPQTPTAAPTPTPATPAAPVAVPAPPVTPSNLVNRPTFKSVGEYQADLDRMNANSEERISSARQKLGLDQSQSPYLGLLAAADYDANTNDFTDEEANYAKELARRAQTSGDQRFAGKNLDDIFKVIDQANKADTDIFLPGEREARAGHFLSGTGQTGFLLGDYLKSVGKTSSGGNQNPVAFYK